MPYIILLRIQTLCTLVLTLDHHVRHNNVHLLYTVYDLDVTFEKLCFGGNHNVTV